MLQHMKTSLSSTYVVEEFHPDDEQKSSDSEAVDVDALKMYVPSDQEVEAQAATTAMGQLVVPLSLASSGASSAAHDEYAEPIGQHQEQHQNQQQEHCETCRNGPWRTMIQHNVVVCEHVWPHLLLHGHVSASHLPAGPQGPP